ncbi:hypothetical protein TNCV_2071431 [Trichonephila clavipes]|uniref:Uncharacterized protein n=1 Tax=Trichonephila clavipes TaxID=2585209 RepID=A0A8X6W3K5_TRICX|nr:hypothetical protein TNCV_2071431 [Trichonephila clavipes]
MDLLPAPGNRSNHTHEIWQRAHCIHRGPGNGGGRPDRTRPNQGRKENGNEKTKSEKNVVGGRKMAEQWIAILYHLNILFFMRCPIEAVQ